MKITVTQSDIDRGIRKSYNHCPIALAASRVFTGYVAVVPGLISVYTNGIKCFSTPESALEFIQKFDEGDEVHPFEFEVYP